MDNLTVKVSCNMGPFSRAILKSQKLLTNIDRLFDPHTKIEDQPYWLFWKFKDYSNYMGV